MMPDLSNAEISVEGEYGECLACGLSFHWEQLINTVLGFYCDVDVPSDEGDMGHDTNLERDTFGDAL